MKLHIRNMVCPRCIAAVKQLLEQNHIKYMNVTLGEVLLEEGKISEELLQAIDAQLKKLGFELVTDHQMQLIEAIKTQIIKTIHYDNTTLQNKNVNWSDILSDKLGHDYKSLSRQFSTLEGITIEQYIIRQKIEKVKELLIYDQLTLSEIADRLGYSSVAHLSGQFNKITGMSPSTFINQSERPRFSLDEI